MSGSGMKTNIVMLVKDRWTLTEQSLISLLQHTDKESYNLTVVDDESADMRRSDELAISLSQMPNSTILRVTNSSGITGRARNLGVYWSEQTFGRGDFLYLSDNDVYFTPGWLEKLTDALIVGEDQRPQYGLIGGSNHPYHGINDTVWLSSGPGAEIREHYAVAGTSQLMRWKTWDLFGPLNAGAKGVRQSEDGDFCNKIVEAGGKVGSLYPEVVLACGILDTFGEESPGPELMLEKLIAAKKKYPDLIW